MNERIEQLARQVDAGYIPRYDMWQMDSETMQKFAELIVKEAGKYLMRPEFIGRSDLDWSMVLNEHFGVSE